MLHWVGAIPCTMIWLTHGENFLISLSLPLLLSLCLSPIYLYVQMCLSICLNHLSQLPLLNIPLKKYLPSSSACITYLHYLLHKSRLMFFFPVMIPDNACQQICIWWELILFTSQRLKRASFSQTQGAYASNIVEGFIEKRVKDIYKTN